jgi:hypothetical protein
VRSWCRYRTRLSSAQVPEKSNDVDSGKRLPLSGRRTLAYWTSNGSDRTNLLTDVNGVRSAERIFCLAA